MWDGLNYGTHNVTVASVGSGNSGVGISRFSYEGDPALPLASGTSTTKLVGPIVGGVVGGVAVLGLLIWFLCYRRGKARRQRPRDAWQSEKVYDNRRSIPPFEIVSRPTPNKASLDAYYHPQSPASDNTAPPIYSTMTRSNSMDGATSSPASSSFSPRTPWMTDLSPQPSKRIRPPLPQGPNNEWQAGPDDAPPISMPVPMAMPMPMVTPAVPGFAIPARSRMMRPGSEVPSNISIGPTRTLDPIPEQQTPHSPTERQSSLFTARRASTTKRETGDSFPFLSPRFRNSSITRSSVASGKTFRSTTTSIHGLSQLLEIDDEVWAWADELRFRSSTDGSVRLLPDSVMAFVNRLAPGAGNSISEIDFSALNNATVRVVGVYGNKGELQRFFKRVGGVSSSSTAQLQPGLYAYTPSQSSSAPTTVYIVYWPEDTTWQTETPDPSQTTRAAFLHHLTSLSNSTHILLPEDMPVLPSDGDGQSDSVLDESGDDDAVHSYDFKVIRQFQVAFNGTSEVRIPTVPRSQIASGQATDPLVSPFLSSGTSRVSLVVPIQPSAQIVESAIKQSFDRGDHLRAELWKYGGIRFSDDGVDKKALDILFDHGYLKARVPAIYQRYKSEIEVGLKNWKERHKEDEFEMDRALRGISEDHAELVAAMDPYIKSVISQTFPLLDFQQEQSHDEIDRASEYLNALWAAYPPVQSIFGKIVQEANLHVVDSYDYRQLKTHFLAVKRLADKQRGLDYDQIADMIQYSISDFADVQADDGGNR
ncbi:hypothetical protein FRB99_002116, partial [Tulasnella sp. 403]